MKENHASALAVADLTITRLPPLLCLAFGLAFQPAPLALLVLVWSLRTLSQPFVVPGWPRAKRAALPLIGLLTQMQRGDMGSTLLVEALVASAGFALFVYQTVKRRKGSLSCDYSTGPQKPASSLPVACIFLHGLGSDGAQVSALRHISSPTSVQMRWSFPTAPVRCMTVDWGLPRLSWFDIVAIDDTTKRPLATAAAIDDGVALVLEEVQRLGHEGIPPHRVVLAGFSQGGAIALAAALACRTRLGGVAVFSGFVPGPRPLACTQNAHLPLLWCHGAKDENVPIDLMNADLRSLTLAGLQSITPRVHSDLAHDLMPAASTTPDGSMHTPLHDFRDWLICLTSPDKY